MYIIIIIITIVIIIVYTYIHIYIYIYICIYIYLSIFLSIYLSLSLYLSIYLYIYIYMYITYYTHKHTDTRIYMVVSHGFFRSIRCLQDSAHCPFPRLIPGKAKGSTTLRKSSQQVVNPELAKTLQNSPQNFPKLSNNWSSQNLCETFQNECA